MKTIWKFPLDLPDRGFVASINVPEGAELLCVQVQDLTPCLWALVDPAAPLVRRGIRVVGTGHDAGACQWIGYVGTFQLMDGGLVFHVFEDPCT